MEYVLDHPCAYGVEEQTHSDGGHDVSRCAECFRNTEGYLVNNIRLRARKYLTEVSYHKDTIPVLKNTMAEHSHRHDAGCKPISGIGEYIYIVQLPIPPASASIVIAPCIIERSYVRITSNAQVPSGGGETYNSSNNRPVALAESFRCELMSKDRNIKN